MKREYDKNWLLFITFLKIGAFTFGGGYAMIPLIQREIMEKRQWITNDDLLELIAIAESTPGPIAINLATFIGFRVGGFWGAAVGTLGIIIPSFVIILAISFVMKEFQALKIVRYAFNGIRGGVLALMIKALFSMYGQMKKELFCYIIMGITFISTVFLHINVFLVIIACAILGFIFSSITAGRNMR